MPEKWKINYQPPKKPNTKTKAKQEINVSSLHHQVYSKDRDMKDSGKKKELLFCFSYLSLVNRGWITTLHLPSLVFTSSTAGLPIMRAHSELHPFKCQGFLFLAFETGSLLLLLWHRTGLSSCKPLHKSLLLQRQQPRACLLLEQAMSSKRMHGSEHTCSLVSRILCSMLLKAQNTVRQISWHEKKKFIALETDLFYMSTSQTNCRVLITV